MRIITPASYPVFTYSELSPDAKANARQHIYDRLVESDYITSDMRMLAAEWLTNEGWTGLHQLEFTDGPDLEKMQFSVSHSQGDFVAWNSTRPWDYNGTELIVRTTMHHRGGGSVSMSVGFDEDDYDSLDKMPGVPQGGGMVAAIYDAERKAKEMVKDHARQVLAEMSNYDLNFTDEDSGFDFDDFAESNGIEFTEAGTIH